MPDKPTSSHSEPDPPPRLCLRKPAPDSPTRLTSSTLQLKKDLPNQQPAGQKKPLKLKFTPKYRTESELSGSPVQAPTAENAPPITPSSENPGPTRLALVRPESASGLSQRDSCSPSGAEAGEVRPRIRLKMPEPKSDPMAGESALLPNETLRSLPKTQTSRHGNVPPIAITPAESFSAVPRMNGVLFTDKPTDKPFPKSDRPSPSSSGSARKTSKPTAGEPPLFRDENDASSFEEDTPTEHEELTPRIAGDAIRRAIEAELEAIPERRTIKLATIAAGLFFSTLAVWWSLSGSPFSSRSLDQAAQEPTPAGPTEIRVRAETQVVSVAEEINPTEDPVAAKNSLPRAGPNPTPAVTAFINSLEINVLPLEAASRVILVGDISYREGSLLEPTHGLTLAHIDEEARTLYFRDAVGALYNRSY